MLKKIIIVFLLIYLGIFVFHQIKPMPEGLAYASPVVFSDNIKFYSDLTYYNENQQRIIFEHYIFEEVFSLINQAKEFIVLDMFLYNDIYPDDLNFPELSKRLTDQLIEKKRNNPEIKIVVITDPLNGFYSSYIPWQFKVLESYGINVVETNLNPLRDSSPFYSSIWRMFFEWTGVPNKQGWLVNPINPDGPKGSFRSVLKLLNFKANHRKLIVSEQGGIIMSANPHDASVFNSNIAFSFDKQLVPYVLASETAVLQLSKDEDLLGFNYKVKQKESGLYKVQMLTESKIKSGIIEEIKNTAEGDQIKIAMFFLSEANVLKELFNASERGVDVLLILDANKDAFGKEKSGIPNRPVANRIFNKSQGKIKIRWYKTHGEQFHSKLVFIKKKEDSVVFGGSANLTRRNLSDYNLEANIKVVAKTESPLVEEVERYFLRIESPVYSDDYSEYKDDSKLKYFLYVFQELTGLSTF